MLIEKISKQTGISELKLIKLAQTASKRYKIYSIPKRNGGQRIIHHPSRQLKAIQRWINAFLFDGMAVHSDATAYRKETNIRQNAIRHAGTNYTLHLDFENFFPSFEIEGINGFLQEKNIERSLGLSNDDILFVCLIVCRYDALTIGAPTSPALTNAMMFDFDSALSKFCSEKNFVMTRYADDIHVSSYKHGLLNEAYDHVRFLADSQKFVSLRLNHKKTAFLSKRYRRQITGLVVTPDREISIGRGNKRKIKSLVFQFINDEISIEDLVFLKGYLSFVSDVDRRFYESLEKKYGSKCMRRLLS